MDSALMKTRGDQNDKMQEISELLVAAGYFRARIKGISSFDKIVGGMAWAIEVCAVDIDVDLPFNENLSIGQKISLTEKIVRVLLRMKCPHRIEPHQIQGLDFDHIFPVIQWLVKKAIETKAETEDIHREYAVYLFNKTHGSVDTSGKDTSGRVQSAAAFSNAYAVLQERYRPRRRYRHHARHTLKTEAAQVQATLLEYGSGTHRMRGPEGDQSQQESEVILSNMAPLASAEGRLSAKSVGNIVQQQAAEAREIAEDLERRPMIQMPGVARHARLLNSVQKQLEAKKELLQKGQDQLEKLREEYELLQKEDKEAEAQLEEVRAAAKRIAEGVGSQEPQLAKLCTLLRINAELADQEARFRASCRQEMQRLQELVASPEPEQAAGNNAEDSQVEAQCQQERERLQRMRLLLAKKNREIAAIQRKIDEVPSRAELNQYQRRFVELYGQVAATHRETKQFFTLYNTLDDIRMYLDKEIGLLNSVLENFTEAMSNPATKDQFLEQFEQIVEGVKQNRLKVEKKRQEAKMSRDRLHDSLLELVDKQRLYFRTVKEFKEECRKNEVLVGKLKESSGKQR
ncbi:coiled-coil domain-containing protein 93-like [Dermacentor silvarum]|uniref:coiled-coil domain-containing protein 93-like n=1 Tax=Dermacentor silvarum TaxID=543639 RepID=UPI00189BCA8B|nr:coiled-coil domain-containing protein 93-like [Dermacentor silvarum]